MKKIILNIFLVFLFSVTTKAQTVLNMAGNNANLPSNYRSTGNYYIKDINNYLDNFTGTWEYVNGNETFRIVLSKAIKFHLVIPLIKLDYYEDGIMIKYKKLLNGNVVFESPAAERPYFNTKNGIQLEGSIIDYGRIAKTVVVPKINKVLFSGGYPLQPNCDIELIPTNANESKKIKFHLYYWDHLTNYDHETYAGQPIFSVPNDIVMTKVE